MKKSQLKQLIREIVEENERWMYNRWEKYGSQDPKFVWDNPQEVEKLKKVLMDRLDAGNFDQAHEVVDKLSNYHN